MFSRRFLSVLVSAALFVCSAVAYAQDVRELNAEGLKAFSEGRFVDAAETFDRAYALEPQAELLKNEAVAWYKAERCENAVESAHQFLAIEPISEADRKQISTLLGACRVKLAEDAIDAGSLTLAESLLDDVDASNPSPALADRVTRARIKLAKARNTAEPAAEETEPDTDPEPPPGVVEEPEPEAVVEVQPTRELDTELEVETPPSRRGVSGWPLVGIGGATLVGAVVYHMVMEFGVEETFKDVARAGEDEDRYEELDRSLKTANVLVPTLYGVGAAATGVGVWLVARQSPEGGSVALLGVSGVF